MVSLKIATVAFMQIASAKDRTYQSPGVNQVNIRGRCAWGMPCDANQISYGCEKMTDSVGVCWSECAGYLPKHHGEGVFMYEGWCYNINNQLAGISEFSGKVARSRKRRARMSQSQLDAIQKTQEATTTAAPFNEVNHGFLMGKPLSLYQSCESDDDCAFMARKCAIGCSNQIEASVSFDLYET